MWGARDITPSAHAAVLNAVFQLDCVVRRVFLGDVNKGGNHVKLPINSVTTHAAVVPDKWRNAFIDFAHNRRRHLFGAGSDGWLRATCLFFWRR